MQGLCGSHVNDGTMTAGDGTPRADALPLAGTALQCWGDKLEQSREVGDNPPRFRDQGLSHLFTSSDCDPHVFLVA